MPRMELTAYQLAAINNPFTHFAFYAGVGVGKSYTGSHYVIKMVREHPNLTGFIGANTYDQLNQATLRELFYWLSQYGFEYVINKQPPSHWTLPYALPKYNNVLSIKNPDTGSVTFIFTRVLLAGDKLRGIEFAWYWIDETRDTPQNTHEILISRMREDDFMKGLLTSTTNGEDWSFKRFVQGNIGDGTYGSMHVPTIEAVNAGILTQRYYRTMLQTYSELLAEQELHARHVNVTGGRAYYAFSERNRQRFAPWGDPFPVRGRPLIVGCDFNFSPAPHTWIVGQVGPSLYDEKGLFYGDCIHWFRELSGVGVSTTEMTMRLLSSFPGYFYEVYGDMSGRVGTTSNAGQVDFDQISIGLSDADALYTISVEQMDESESKSNPRVRSRVENMNAMAKNAAGEVRQTYDPEGCPLFDGDTKMVGWKETQSSGRGTLSDAGDKLRTHSSDAAGYAVWKKFPPGRIARLIEGNVSAVRHGI